MMASVFEDPQQLLFTDPESGQLSLNHNVLDELSTVTKKINSVAITGPYRTGKSYLLTRLAGKYKVGCTIESETKGIWAWCVDHPEHEDQVLLLLDIEGFGDIKKGDSNDDNKLFTLATLLSSTLIYNKMGTFDEDALNKLHFITEMSKRLKTSDTSHNDAEFDMYFPDFILALRDFTLLLRKDGKEITPDEYLEDCLEARQGDSEETRRFNEPRLCIRKYFNNRKCFVFENPTSRSKLEDLENLSDSDLNEEFVENTKEFLHHIMNYCEPMKNKGFNVSGRMFSNLAINYTEAIRRGDIPCIERAFRYVALVENEAAVKEAFDLYVQEMKNNAILPTEDAQSLRDTHIRSKSVAFEHYIKRRVLDDDGSYKDKLDGIVHREYRSWLNRNQDASGEKCSEVLEQLHSKIRTKIKAGHYAVSGGFDLYAEDCLEMKRQYEDTPGLGVKKEEALVQYTHNIESEAEAIRTSDETISKTQTITDRMVEENGKMIQNCLQQLEKKMEDLTKHHEKEFEMLKKLHFEQMAKESARMDALAAKHIHEINRLQAEHLYSIAEQRKQEIENIREGNEKTHKELKKTDQLLTQLFKESMNKFRELKELLPKSRKCVLM